MAVIVKFGDRLPARDPPVVVEDREQIAGAGIPMSLRWVRALVEPGEILLFLSNPLISAHFYEFRRIDRPALMGIRPLTGGLRPCTSQGGEPVLTDKIQIGKGIQGWKGASVSRQRSVRVTFGERERSALGANDLNPKPDKTPQHAILTSSII